MQLGQEVVRLACRLIIKIYPFADSVVGVIFHIYDTRYKQSTLYIKTLLPPHCLPLEHTASCTMKVKIAIRRSQSLEAIPPTMLKVNVLKMGSNPC